MSAAPVLLQPLAFPLRGSRLIEASAGTGKTFTIAALYLRLVLGHGASDAAFARPLAPPEILVVTFTDAATGELRDRIRARLVEAAAAFGADPAQVAARERGEDFLHDLRADYPPERWPACARQLRLAADWMDEAAISTIHAWCNRMLREHAFDSDSLFTQALEADQDDLLAEVVRDYWRTFFYPLDAAAAAAVRAWWKTPEDLFADLRGLLKHADPDAPALAVPPAQTLADAQAEAGSRLALIKQPWSTWVGELRGLLDTAVARKWVNGRRVQARWYGPWLEALQSWAEGAHVIPDVGDVGWVRLTPDGMAEVWLGAEPCPDHPALADMTTLRARLAALPDGREDVLRHATAWVAQRFAREQDRRAQMGFDDLLTQLRRALTGPNGQRLAELIRAQFPVAMIDEFQDTDATQYAIFDAIYGVAGNDDGRALVLIGDPKQAIYAFRGADIHTYLAARRDTAGRHATLGRNFRSTEAMVRAVNHVFESAERRDGGRGAFLFRQRDGDALPFVAVDAQGRAETLHIDGAPASALTCWWQATDAEAVGVGEYMRRMAEGCAAEVVRLLNLGRQGRAGFATAGGALRPLAAGDVAILVNKGVEADAVRRALAAGGVRSVYLSDQTSVFGSEVAGDLERWLQACAGPTDARLLRAALATSALGLSLHELDRLNHDELHWDERIEQFRGYQRCWQRQGVLPMLRRLLHDFDVPRRLLARGDERMLTDALHLAELLQVAGELLDGEHALIRHLAEQRARDDRTPGARQVRLESDAGLVKVVTVHKSKGLEYPLVFLPFAAAFRATKPDDVPLRWHDDEGRPRVSLKAEGDVVARVDDERLGEDLRKLYVALTRARFATWIGLAPVAGFERSAIGYLVTGGEPVAAAGFEGALAAFAHGCSDLALAKVPAPGGERHAAMLETGAAERTLVLPQRREAWWIASYSALRTVDETLATAEAAPGEAIAVPEDAAQGTWEETRRADAPAAESAARTAAAAGLHAFPRGADAGNFLHGLLEWAAGEGFARVRADPAALHDQVARRCNVAGWSAWIVPVMDWLRAWLETPLPLAGGQQVRPHELRGAKAELEFWFAASRVDTQALDAVVRRHVLPGHDRPALEPARINGMLKGFIDLVFEHEGRYHVADYKSNWLGPDDAAYTPEAMRGAILEHRYELQYALYLFALHRHLRARLPDYDYDRHVGGATYLFLRGHGAATHGAHSERPPRALVDELDALFTAAAAASEIRS